MSKNVAQAAVWHIANGLSHETLAAKKVVSPNTLVTKSILPLQSWRLPRALCSIVGFPQCKNLREQVLRVNEATVFGNKD